MADDHRNGLAHELLDRGDLTLEVEPGPLEFDDGDAPPAARVVAREPLESLDPVRLYLRQAARSRLLGREEESAIARRIDDAERERRAAVLGSPIGLRWILGLPAALSEGTLQLEDVLADRQEDGE